MFVAGFAGIQTCPVANSTLAVIDCRFMWCSTCQQDVPAIASPEDQKVRCAKCRKEIVSRKPAASNPKAIESPRTKPATKAVGDVPSEAFIEVPPFDLDTWEWDELREARRVVGAWGSKTHDEPTLAAPRREIPIPIVNELPRPKAKTAKTIVRKTTRKRRFNVISWGAMSLGVMACVFGGVLLAWSFWTDRPDLWSLGLPFAIGGQAALVFGLVLQLDGLWQSNDEAVESLGELDEQIIELRRATSQISSSHSGPGQSFYFHLAEGCSPHMLLADLKGQLDLLALRIADNK